MICGSLQNPNGSVLESGAVNCSEILPISLKWSGLKECNDS